MVSYPRTQRPTLFVPQYTTPIQIASVNHHRAKDRRITGEALLQIVPPSDSSNGKKLPQRSHSIITHSLGLLHRSFIPQWLLSSTVLRFHPIVPVALGVNTVREDRLRKPRHRASKVHLADPTFDSWGSGKKVRSIISRCSASRGHPCTPTKSPRGGISSSTSHSKTISMGRGHRNGKRPAEKFPIQVERSIP